MPFALPCCRYQTGGTLEQAQKVCTLFSDCVGVAETSCDRIVTTKTWYYCKSMKDYTSTYYCGHERQTLDTVKGTCKPHPVCRDSEYLASSSPFAAGECMTHTGCDDDTFLNVYGSKAGTCDPCANVDCSGTGTQITKYRDGVCDTKTKGYTCLDQPTCGRNQYLDGATLTAQGACKDHPECKDDEILEGDSLATEEGVCSICEEGKYLDRSNGVCTVCPEKSCDGDQFMKGSCAGTEDSRTCQACANAICPDHHYRKGFCEGRKNDYFCVGQPSCQDEEYLAGADPTTQGVCSPCDNINCKEGTYRDGNCEKYTNGFKCIAQPDCKPLFELADATPFAKGECVLIPTTTTTTSSTTRTTTSSSGSSVTSTTTSTVTSSSTSVVDETTAPAKDGAGTENQKALAAANQEFKGKKCSSSENKKSAGCRKLQKTIDDLKGAGEGSTATTQPPSGTDTGDDGNNDAGKLNGKKEKGKSGNTDTDGTDMTGAFVAVIIVVILLLGVVAFLGYYFHNQKKNQAHATRNSYDLKGFSSYGNGAATLDGNNSAHAGMVNPLYANSAPSATIDNTAYDVPQQAGEAKSGYMDVSPGDDSAYSAIDDGEDV